MQKKADLELAEARKAEKAARSYDSFLNVEVDDEEEEGEKPKYNSVREMEDDFMWVIIVRHCTCSRRVFLRHRSSLVAVFSDRLSLRLHCDEFEQSICTHVTP